MTQLFYQIEINGKRAAEISAVNDAIHEVVRQLAIKFGVIKERKAVKVVVTWEVVRGKR